MFVLLSPAKKLDLDPAPRGVASTRPHFASQARALATRAQQLNVQDLKRLMKLSDALAELNVDRFQHWSDDPADGTPAALTFAGDVYQGLDAPSLTDDDLRWAQEHIGILSGLYGLLRPLDRIAPYRLEMGTALDTDRGGSLYDFWGTQIGERLHTLIEGHAAPTVIDLASQEYARAVPSRVRPPQWITPIFRDVSNGKARTISFYAKRARGEMARWIIQNRVEQPESLKRAVISDYRFVPDQSTDTRWVFHRPKPPPARG